jgi:hypothetical protein
MRAGRTDFLPRLGQTDSGDADKQLDKKLLKCLKSSEIGLCLDLRLSSSVHGTYGLGEQSVFHKCSMKGKEDCYG